MKVEGGRRARTPDHASSVELSSLKKYNQPYQEDKEEEEEVVVML